MKWYLAKIIYRIVCGTGNHKPQFDEQLRLIAALESREAFEKASLMGRTGAGTFYKENRQLVQWQFINIAELNLIDELADGAEIYSSIHELEHAEAYISFVHYKAQQVYRREEVLLHKMM